MLGFRDQYKNAGSELRGHIAKGGAGEAERLAHSLKSVAAMLEARDLAEAASAIEQAFRTERLEGLSSLLDALEEALVPAITAVNSLDSQMPAPPEPMTEALCS
jgi:HPt (histidine-containing phosphotransfer) domain-containing protein